ncbi:MAG: winged helix-turn-helix domain-containing protein [Methanobacteriota archaeon]
MARRERWAVVGSILYAIDEEHRTAGDRARMTRVATRANLAYDRLQVYIADLTGAGLVARNGGIPHITESGMEFLRRYRIWQECLRGIGLEAPVLRTR